MKTLLPVLAVAPFLLHAAPFHLARVGYIMLGSSDLHKAARFYGNTLGLKIASSTNDTVFIDAGSISIVLNTEIGKEPGSTEVVFAVEHVETAYDALKQSGVEFSHAPHQVTASSWAANFRDPDGHNLSLFGPR